MSSTEYDGTPGKSVFIEQTPVKPPSPYTERLNHPEWRNVDYPEVDFVGTETENVPHMSPPLVVDVAEKVCLLNISFAQVPRGQKGLAYGQLGFLLPPDDDKLEDSEGKFEPRPVTNLHNVVLEKKYRYLFSEIKCGVRPYVINFPNVCEWDDLQARPLRRNSNSEFTVRNDSWQHGIDITWGEFLGGGQPDELKKDHCFTMVRKDFQIEKDQRIGIAVFMPPDDALNPMLEADHPNLKLDTLRAIYGCNENRKANIYAGEIKYVGDHHIEYDLNSFQGCAGAIVFLLDRDQPKSVTKADYGKAIAVHAGAHPDKVLKHNLGFLFDDDAYAHFNANTTFDV